MGVVLQANDVVGLFAHGSEILRGCHRDRKYERLRVAHACGAQGRTGGRTRSNAVVYDDRGTACDVHAFAAAEIALPPPLDLGELLLTDGLEILLVDPGKPNDILIANDDWRAAIHHGTHGEFRLERHTNLPDENQVEWRVQRDCDLGGDGYATAREREYNRLPIFVLREHCGELASRIPAIIERHGTLLVSRTRDLCPGAQTAAKMPLEPARGMADHRLQRSRLWKQVARTRNDFQRFRTTQARERLFVEFDDAEIDAAHDQERRRVDLTERVAGQVGTPTAGDDRAHPIAEPGRGHKRRRCPGAGAEQAEWKTAHNRLPSEPTHDVNKPLCQKPNIEDVGPIGFLLHSQQVEQQRCNAFFV